jgi:hypothetical protein
MRTSSFSNGDSGDTGDKAVFTASRRVPTTETASGTLGTNSRAAKPDFANLPCPQFQATSGDTRESCVYGAVPIVPSCPHQKRSATMEHTLGRAIHR